MKQVGGDRRTRLPAFGLEQRKKRRQRLDRRIAQQNGMNRQARGVTVRRQMAIECHADFGPDPALHAIAPDQHDERPAPSNCLLQFVQPAVAGTCYPVILEHSRTGHVQLTIELISRCKVRAAVAQKDGWSRCHVGVRTG